MIRMRGYVSQGTSRLARSRFSLKVDLPRKWLISLLASTVIFAFLLLANLSLGFLKTHRASIASIPVEAEKMEFLRQETGDGAHVPPTPPKLAYLISGSKWDGDRIQRTLQALYHPHNYYLLHLDLEASPRERRKLDRYVKQEPVFKAANNVFLVEKPNLVTYRGPTMIATTLHGAAILLRKAQDWTWFINLSASDYPLVTQDDLLHVFSYLPKDLNFLEHTSDMGAKEDQRAYPIIVDPGLYQKQKTDIFWGEQTRTVPNSFRLFTGSAWTLLTREFVEYCNRSWDALPRLLLLYYTNFVSSPEGYYHTVICNTPSFRNTTVNHDLHFIAWDYPPQQHPLTLTLRFFSDMVNSGAAFARKFNADDPVLHRIDRKLLNRKPGGFTPGGWCVGKDEKNPCSVAGDARVLKPGPGARRLEELVLKLLAPEEFRAKQCAGA